MHLAHWNNMFDVYELLLRTITASIILFLVYLSAYAPIYVIDFIIMAIAVYIIVFEIRYYTKAGTYIKKYQWTTLDAIFALSANCIVFFTALLLILINHSVVYRRLLLLLIATVACHDTAAYVFGKLFGKHLLFPHISPRKTWEGALGGFVAVIGTLLFFAYYYHQQLPPFGILVLIGIGISLCAVVGDALESAYKRYLGIKDMGTLLPGHGGVFDRVDSLIATTPFVYLCKHILITYF